MTYFIVFLFKYSITSWIAGFLFYSVGAIFVFHLSIVITLVIIGFLTPFVVKYLNETSYKNLNLKPYATILGAFWVFLKAFFMMILLYILFIPLYFIPLINFIALYLPLYYFFHKMLNYDVSSTILSKEEYEKFTLNLLVLLELEHFFYILFLLSFCYTLCLNFLYYFLSHAYFIELEKLQK
ncbi:hypothetical protein MASR2M54_02620 [Aliarcobacter cryaerophilus]